MSYSALRHSAADGGLVDDQPPFFSREEYKQRLAAVREVMRAHGAEVLLIDEVSHLCYLTGFDPSASTYQVSLISLDRDPITILRALEEPNFREQTWFHDCVTYGDAEDPVHVLRRTLVKQRWLGSRIGFELGSHYLTASRYEKIRNILPECTFVDFDFSEALWQLRLRKSPREILYLHQAARIADDAMAKALGALRVGESERAAAIAAKTTILELGGDDGLVGRITSGKRSGYVKGNLRNHVLVQGDIVHIELWPTVHGYLARLIRPALMGSPTPGLSSLAKKLVEIQDEQIAAMKPGAIARDVDRICREGVLQAGLRQSYTNLTGYTLGYHAPFGPRENDFTRVFLPTSTWTLEPNMVMHVFAGAGGIAFSETVLIAETGPERLTTRVERKLFSR